MEVGGLGTHKKKLTEIQASGNQRAISMPRHRQREREWRLGDVLMLILLGLLYLFLVMLALALLSPSSLGQSIAKPSVSCSVEGRCFAD